MKCFLKPPASGEKGIALPTVLVFLLFGAILIAPSLNFAGTSIISLRSEENALKGLYAADAGIEDVLWSLKNAQPPRTSLPQNINGFTVSMQTETMGEYVFYQGECIVGSGHSDYVLMSSTLQPDAGGTYLYTISLTLSENATGNVKLSNVGAMLPEGYTFVTGSAGVFPTNLSTAAPSDTTTAGGIHMLNWSLPSINLTGTRTQVFRITGTGTLGNYYAWAAATRADVGAVSELDGEFYRVTATAVEGADTVGMVTADIMKNGTSLKITSWRIN